MGYIGAVVRRGEDPRLLTGKGQYVGDLRPPGLLHLAVLRSPHPKARIARLDVARARAAPGVALVLTGDDLRALPSLPTNRLLPEMKVPDQPILPVDVVHIVGAPVAVVVAASRAQAEDATELIDVEYEALPSVADAEVALRDDAPLVHAELGTNLSFRLVQQAGDPDAAFANAHRVASVRVAQARVAAVALEARGVLAAYDRHADQVTIWSSTQTPNRVRATIAELIGAPESRIRVIVPDVGGAFGAKAPTYREDLLCVLAARKLDRPVCWSADRIEDLQTTQQARDMVAYLDAAIDEHCRITAIRLRLIANLGAFLNPGTPVPSLVVLAMATGAYRVSNFRAEALGVLTDTMITGPYRGAGGPEAMIFIERLVDEVADVCGLDPAELRRRNFIPPELMPYETATGVTYDSGTYEKTLDEALRLADYAELRAAQARVRARGGLFGVGLATFIAESGDSLPESGLVRVEPTGAVSAWTGSSHQGQAHLTTFAQVLADRLGVPFEAIAVRSGDTAAVPPGTGTFGSRSVFAGASALSAAADRILGRATRIAAQLLEAPADGVILQNGRFVVAELPERGVDWGQVASAAHGRGGSLPPGEPIGLEETVYWTAPRSSWSHGAYLAAVSIDPESGLLTLEKLIAVDDCGTVINPLLVEGQVQGGIAQGIGQALLEHVVFDQAGHPLASTLMDYLVPGFDSVPEPKLGRTVTPTPLNPLGAKGIGEAGTIGAPAAILNAVVDALRPLGLASIDFPLTPFQIWRSIAAADAAAAQRTMRTPNSSVGRQAMTSTFG